MKPGLPGKRYRWQRWRLAVRVRALLPLLLALPGILQAAPYIPGNGSQVIERLPGRTDPAQRELRRLRAELAAAPTDLVLAAKLARRYIEQARSEGDPRYLGYAQAALQPWWHLQQPPIAVRVLRATLLQSTHQFAGALLDLNAVLKADRSNAQAWLTRATVLVVTGDYRQASASCERLASLAPELVVQTCLANLGSVNGALAQSYSALQASLQRNADSDPGIRLWVLTLLAEMAARSGDAAAAERHFRQALALDGADSYLLGAYADFLLDRQRPAEVIALLKNKTRIDALLLRYALALNAIKAPAAAAQIEALRARFEAAMRRGDTLHQREQARFMLELQHDPQAALRLAALNWAVQKEPADVRIFIEAAAAANDRAAAQPVLAWLKRTGLEHRALAPALAKIGAAG